MAGSKKDNNKNEFKEKGDRWWIWTLVIVGIVFVLLMVFGKTSSVVADDNQPTNMDPVMNNVDDENENE